MKKCPLCNSSQKKYIWHNKVWGGKKNDKFLHCNNCDIVYLYPFPSQKKVAKFYQNNFGTYMQERSKEINWNNLKKQYDNLYKRELPLRSVFLNRYLKKGNVCDVGCSTGFTLDYISKNKTNQTYGVEPSLEHVKFINPKHKIYSDISDINLRFDNILHYYVLEHVFNPLDFLSNLIKRLKKNGRMIFEIPNRNDALFSLYKIESYKDFIMQKMHLFYFSEKSITYILNKFKIKYKIFRCQRYNFDNHYNWISNNKVNPQLKFFSTNLNKLYMNEICQKRFNDHFTIVLTKI